MLLVSVFGVLRITNSLTLEIDFPNANTQIDLTSLREIILKLIFLKQTATAD